MQATSERRIVENSINQLRLLEDYGTPKAVKDDIQPTFQVNDDLVDFVTCGNAERTSTGTTAVLTTNSKGTTWITGFVLTISESIAP